MEGNKMIVIVLSSNSDVKPLCFFCRGEHSSEISLWSTDESSSGSDGFGTVQRTIKFGSSGISTLHPKTNKGCIAFVLDPTYMKFKYLSLPQICTVCSTFHSSLEEHLKIFNCGSLILQPRASGHVRELVASLPQTNSVYIGKKRSSTL